MNQQTAQRVVTRDDLLEPIRPLRRSRRLEGWDLIARHLGICERQCRRLARKGIITVYKRGPSPKAWVFCDERVLDEEWARYCRIYAEDGRSAAAHRAAS